MIIVWIFIGLVLGVGIGLMFKESEIKKEIKLRKEWEETAQELISTLREHTSRMIGGNIMNQNCNKNG